MAAKQWRLGDAAASPERGAGNASPRVRGYVNLRWCVAGLQIVAWVSVQPATPLSVGLCGAVQPATPLLVGSWGAVQPETPLSARCGLIWAFLHVGGANGFVQVWVRTVGGASGFVQVWVRVGGGVVGFVSCGVVQPEAPLPVGSSGLVQPKTPLPVELCGAVQPVTPLLVGLSGAVQPAAPLLARCGLLWGVVVHRWCQWFRAGLGARRRWCRWFRFMWCCATRDASVGSLWPVMGCFGSSVVSLVSCRFGCASAVVSLVSFRVVLCNPRRLCWWACGVQCNPRHLCRWVHRV